MSTALVGTTTRRPMGAVRTVLLMGFLSAFGPLSMDLYLPSLPHLAASFGVSESAAQLTMSASALGLGAGQFLYGPLSDRIGRRIPIVVGVGLFVIFSVACAFAPTIELLVVFRLLQGLSGAAGMVVARAAVRDMYTGRELARMFSLLMLVSGTAPIVAPIIGGLLANIMDWRGIFLVLAGVGAAIWLASMLGLRETLSQERRHKGGLRAIGQGFAIVAKDRFFIGLILVFAAMAASFTAYLQMSSFVFQDQFGFTPQQFSWVFASNAIAIVIGTQLNGVLLRRFGPRQLLPVGVIARLVMAVAMVASVLIFSGPMPMMAFLALTVFFQGAITANTTALALSGHGERAGTASAVLGVGQFIVGPVVGPLASLGGATATSMTITMCVGAALTVVAYYGVVVDHRRKKLA